MLWITYLIILFYALCGTTITKEHTFNNNLLAKETTQSVNGVFIWVVFCCHIASYINVIHPLTDFDPIFKFINGSFRQLLVSTFLFYSGYGVIISIKNKNNYAKQIPVRRILPTMVNFDIAIILFAIVNYLLNIEFSFKQFLLSLICWDSIGNSNWYIFAIVWCYFFTWVSWLLFSKGPKMILCIGLFILIYILVLLIFTDKGLYWHDTILCYLAGTVLGEYKDKLLSFFGRKYTKSVVFFFILFIIAYCSPKLYGFAQNVSAIAFCFIILLLTMKFNFGNKFTRWCGQNLFQLYIYQRIPMIIFSTIGNGVIIKEYVYAYVLLCLLFTLLISYYMSTIRYNK